MPRKRSRGTKWTDPVVLVPIITAVIASIVGPTYYYYILTPKPHEEPPEKRIADILPATGNESGPAPATTVTEPLGGLPSLQRAEDNESGPPSENPPAEGGSIFSGDGEGEDISEGENISEGEEGLLFGENYD